MTIEQCRCGGILKADYSVPGEILEVVIAHRATTRHRAWSAWQEWVTPAERETFNAVVADLGSGLARLVYVNADDFLDVGAGETVYRLVDDHDDPIEVVR